MYRLLLEYPLKTGEIRILNDPQKKCRFCGKSEPEVTFNNKAHCISEFLGNIKLISNYECDFCNSKFSKDEGELASVLLLYRGLRNISGKRGKTKITGGIDVNYTVKSDTFDMCIQGEGHPNLNIMVEDNGVLFEKEICITPFKIYKAILKYALTVLPYDKFIKYAYYSDLLSEKLGGNVLNETFDIYTIILKEPVRSPSVLVYEALPQEGMTNFPSNYVAIEFEQFVYIIFLCLIGEEITPYEGFFKQILNNYGENFWCLCKRNYSSKDKEKKIIRERTFAKDYSVEYL